MWRYLLPLAALAVLVVFFYRGLQHNPGEIPSPLIGRPAPGFELPSVRDANRLVASKDFAGRMYVLNVWGTWCVGCRQEHETLLGIAQTNAVPIVGLNWKDDRELAVRWLDELGDPYVDTAFDPEGRTAIDWGVYGAPETFLISADGRVLHKHIAPLTPEIWERDFLPRIRSGGGGVP
jgi:cytochrome c biogenesis protein CcmG/thiol:disulfide interchange protein DsbE